MPYLRLYSQDVPVEQKRLIAQKLIDITLRAFHLPVEARNRITIQFITLPEVHGIDDLYRTIPRHADFTLEVIGHDLTEGKKKAFTEAAVTVLARLMPAKPRGRVARLLGIKADAPRQVALQFNELSPAISDPFVLDSERQVA